MTSPLSRREFTFAGSVLAFSIAADPLRAASATSAQPKGVPVVVQMIGGDLTVKQRQEMIARITNLLTDVFQLSDPSMVTALSTTSGEHHRVERPDASAG
jgi:hypothetical protein